MTGNLESKFGELSAEARSFLESVGRALREARQQRREDLHDIAAFLRIKPNFLYALEDADYAVFPGRAYAYGFLRSYADYLGFDGGEVVRRVKEVVERPPERLQPEPATSRLRPWIRHAVSGAAIAAVAGILVWQVIERGADGLFRNVAGLVSSDGPVEDGTASAVLSPGGGEDPAAAGDATAGAREPSSGSGAQAGTALPERLQVSERIPPVRVGAGAAPRPWTAETVEASLRHDGTSAVAAEVLGETPPAETAVGLLARLEVEPRRALSADPERPEGRLQLLARGPTWVQVRSRDGSYVRTRSLDAGERYPLPDRSGLTLWVGDAGAVTIVLDGRQLGPVGAPGTVVRDLPLDPDSLPRLFAAR